MRVRCVRSAGAGVLGERVDAPEERRQRLARTRSAPGSACARRSAMAGQPCACAAVASGNEVPNHARTAGENCSQRIRRGHGSRLSTPPDSACQGSAGVTVAIAEPVRSPHGERAHHVRVDVADELVGAGLEVDVELLSRRTLLEVGGRRTGRVGRWTLWFCPSSRLSTSMVSGPGSARRQSVSHRRSSATSVTRPSSGVLDSHRSRLGSRPCSRRRPARERDGDGSDGDGSAHGGRVAIGTRRVPGGVRAGRLYRWVMSAPPSWWCSSPSSATRPSWSP